VSYGDLNLSSETGARVLLARLRGAARSVCAPMDGRGPASFGRYRACVNNAMANAVADINQTIVTRVAKN
jgi:UrcA family protein